MITGQNIFLLHLFLILFGSNAVQMSVGKYGKLKYGLEQYTYMGAFTAFRYTIVQIIGQYTHSHLYKVPCFVTKICLLDKN